MEDHNSLNIPFEVIKTATQELVKKALSLIYNSMKTKIPEQVSSQDKINFEEKITDHFTELYKWSINIGFFGLGTPQLVNRDTVGLNISNTIRKLTNKYPLDDLIEENNLVQNSTNYIIIGDPGSGKTTTLKRLTHHFFFSVTAQNNNYNFPLLVKFRDILEYQNLYTHICDLLGIQYETTERPYQLRVEKKRFLMDEQGKYVTENGEYLVENYYETITKKEYIYTINGEKIDLVIPKIIDQNKVLIIMDGLDELNDSITADIQKQLVELCSRLINSKIIVTCRPDYLEEQYVDFTLCQICDLEIDQLRVITNIWLSEAADSFLTELNGKSYFELARRPLFLCFLLMLYKEDLCLPTSSAEVYKRILDLIITKWDKKRGILRKSKYHKFDSTKKQEFLSHLAYVLTYDLKSKSFDESILQSAYLKIHKRFSLPAEDAMEVCKEISNHTGLIVSAFYEKFEFSHLSIQEYLCALYIVKGQYTSKINEYLKISPAPVAMSIALSSESSLAFTKIVFDFLVVEHIRNRRDDNIQLTKLVKIVLRKIIIEAPFFDMAEYLGLSIMALSRICDCTDAEFVVLIQRFLKLHENIEESLALILTKYSFENKDKNSNKAIFVKINPLSEVDIHTDEIFLKRLCLPLDLAKNYVNIDQN